MLDEIHFKYEERERGASAYCRLCGWYKGIILDHIHKDFKPLHNRANKHQKACLAGTYKFTTKRIPWRASQNSKRK